MYAQMVSITPVAHAKLRLALGAAYDLNAAHCPVNGVPYGTEGGNHA